MNEWIKQDRNAIQASDTLRNFVSMNDEEIDELDRLCDRFQMKIPQYYLDLINPDDPDDPIRKMCIPSPEEFQIKKGELEDPIGDTNESLNNQPVKAITHRYPDRVLLYPTPLCGGYCRFCFRKRLAGKEEYSLNKSELKAGIDYIRSQPSIKEVILTGGDPLMLGDDKLISILEEVRAIPHIWTIRIHTRMPVWNPYRITHELVEGLAKQHPSG
jgi:lysine 2,3-aminomutase